MNEDPTKTNETDEVSAFRRLLDLADQTHAVLAALYEEADRLIESGPKPDRWLAETVDRAVDERLFGTPAIDTQHLAAAARIAIVSREVSAPRKDPGLDELERLNQLARRGGRATNRFAKLTADGVPFGAVKPAYLESVYAQAEAAVAKAGGK